MNITNIKDSEVYVIDLSYILYRSYHSLKNLGVTNEFGVFRPTGHIVGVLSALTGIKDFAPNAIILITLDGYPVARRELCESVGIEYKAGRSKPEYNIKADISMICDLACHIPDTYIVESDDEESDDIMFALSRHLDKSNKVYLYTRDNDLLQAINDNTFVVRDFKDGKPTIVDYEVYMNSEEFTKKFYSVPPNRLPYFRALTGDSSDNIKGVTRIPRTLARNIALSINDIVRDFGYATIYLAQAMDKPKTQLKYLQAIEEDASRLLVNYKIMKLDSDLDYYISRDVNPIEQYLCDLRLESFKKWLESSKNKEV